MKISVTFLFLLALFSARSQEHGRGKGLVLTLYDKQDRIYGSSWDQEERTIYFYPYLVDKSFEDSLSNRYASADVIDLYHRDPPAIIRRKIDPAEMYPVTTKEMTNRFYFFVDLRHLTPDELDSCQAFLEYFRSQMSDEEEFVVSWVNSDNTFYHTYTHNKVPVLGNDPSWYPRKLAGEIHRVDPARHIWKTVEGRDGTYTIITLSSLPAINAVYIYLGRTADFASTEQEMTNLNTVYRTRHRYMHYIDLSEDDKVSPFEQAAKLAGGLGMKFSDGKEALTKTIMNDLVVHYLWKEKGMEDSYGNSQQTSYPAPQEPKPAKPSPPLPSKPRPVILGEPAKKPLPRPVLRN